MSEQISNNTPDQAHLDIPDIELLKLVGSGSYGEVWLARTITGALRAVKIVRQSSFHSSKSYEREFNGIKQFEEVSRTHPGLVEVLHVGRNKNAGYYYCIMERADPLDGASDNIADYQPKTLSMLIQQDRPCAIAFTLDTGREIAAALAALHQANLVHRDIKPSNIIFVKGKPKLADIGMVAASGQRSFVGTEGYVPPEGPGTVRADVYSLGKVIYEMATGKDRLDFPELPESWFNHAPEKKRQLHLLNDVICKACNPRPDQRYKDAGQLERALTATTAARETTRRTFSATGIITILLALLTALGAYFYYFHKLPNQPHKGSHAAATPTPTPALATGSLKVISPPAGAKVLIAGEHLGETPFYLENAAVGPLTVRLELAGHKPLELRGVIEHEQQLLIGSKLEAWLKPIAGQSWVNSDGIEFLAEGERYLSSTPVPPSVIANYVAATGQAQTAEIEAKEEFLRWYTGIAQNQGYLENHHYYRLATAAELAQAGLDNQTDTGKFHLVVDTHPLGDIVIRSLPAGAGVYHGDSFLGNTPLKLTGQSVGELKLSLQLEGYTSTTANVEVVANQSSEHTVALERNNRAMLGQPWQNSLGMEFRPVTEADVLFAVWETRVADYSEFVAATGRQHEQADFEQQPDHPVVLVTKDDARAFCKWLTGKERDLGLLSDTLEYRLPTDLEWSIACGFDDEGGASPAARDSGNRVAFPWGTDWPPQQPVANLADVTSAYSQGQRIISGYHDGFPKTAPVGSFPPNQYGLHDLSGNVWEWVADNYGGGGSFNDWAVCRGGGWSNFRKAQLWISCRNLVETEQKDVIYGFRVVIASPHPANN